MEIVTLYRSRTCLISLSFCVSYHSSFTHSRSYKLQKPNPVNHTHLKANANINHRSHQYTQLPSHNQDLLLSFISAFTPSARFQSRYGQRTPIMHRSDSYARAPGEFTSPQFSPFMASQSEKKVLGTSTVKMSASGFEMETPERAKLARRVREWVGRKIDKHWMSWRGRGNACDLGAEKERREREKAEKREEKMKKKAERKARRERARKEWREKHPKSRYEYDDGNSMLFFATMNMNMQMMNLQ